MKRFLLGAALFGLGLCGTAVDSHATPVREKSIATRVTTRAVITSDWKSSKAEAFEDAKTKALAKALNAYEIVETRVRVKGQLRRVVLVIEY